MKRAPATGRVECAVGILTAILLAMPLIAQAQTTTAPTAAPAMPPWQIAAGGKMKFSLVSIHQDTSGTFKQPSFALSADDGMPPTDGNFHADFPLIVYIQFAYKQWFTDAQMRALLAPLPKWVLTDSYEIQARAARRPTKDQVRLMLQSLLADRFGLQAHFETRTVPVYLLTQIKPGKMGPRLHPHTPACGTAQPVKSPAVKDVFPPLCLDKALMTIPQADHVKLTGSRNMPLSVLAMYLPTMGDLDRPVIDRTAIKESVDFSLEFTPEAFLPMDPGADADTPVTSFQQALQNQLGLMLAPSKAPVDVLVIDHVERPIDNLQ
jgi:bla regulator protein BlaR1